jgi:hypothetical protein
MTIDDDGSVELILAKSQTLEVIADNRGRAPDYVLKWAARLWISMRKAKG